MVSLPNNLKQQPTLVCFAAIGLFTLACSNDEDTPSLSNLGGSTSTTGGTSDTISAGAQNESGGSTSSAAGGTTSSSHTGGEAKSRTGEVVIYSAARSTPCTVAAAFYESLPPYHCATVRDLGACVVTVDCSDPAATATLTSAGDVSVKSTQPVLDVKLVSGQDNHYGQSAMTCLSGTELLSINASGATVPAFSAELNVPLVLLADAPAADSAGVIAASPSAALELKVSRGAADVRLVVSGTSATTGVTLVCDAESTQGSLTIPAAALEAVGKGTELTLYTAKTTPKTAGSWHVDITTYMSVYTPDRANAVSIRVQ